MIAAKELVERAMERFRKRCTGELIGPQVACDQPYDSPWEQDFQWQLQKNLPDWFKLTNQEPFGPYRADFCFTDVRDNRQWIVEFDGREFHNEVRDEARDANILKFHANVQAIVRVDANTGHHEYIETRGILSRLLPECFDMRLSIFHPWRYETRGVFTSQVFDDRHDYDSWSTDGELDSDAPMRHLRISIRSRSEIRPFDVIEPEDDEEYF